MKRLKVMTIVGTRPEIIKLSRVLAELRRHTDHTLVHTGQNYDYELNEVFFQELGIDRPDFFLEAVGESAAESIGLIISRADKAMEQVGPDAILLYGDTNSCLSAIAAKRRKIPVFHMEAGNRCFDQRVPEEVNRKIIDHISDVNMPLTEHARRYLIAEGLRPETIIKTGSAMFEVLRHYRESIDGSDVVQRLGLTPKQYFVFSSHREENVDPVDKLKQVTRLLTALAEQYNLPIIFSVHPRTRNRIEKLAEQGAAQLPPQVRLSRPFGFFDYNRLQLDARCVLSDSGTIAEEASILGFPAVTLREAHERPEGMDEGVLVMCGLDAARALQAVDVVTSQYAPGQRAAPLVPDYEAEHVSKQVLRIILSYTDYVNRTVWSKAA